MQKRITVLAATTIDTLESIGADVEDTHFETVQSAIRRARYLLTEDYRIASESSQCLGYSRVVVNDKCVADFFGKS